ncbi:MAG: SDR family oxidoreductase [Proteobacteria bacterium]|nr:SDR family oxidoreductase [Pseudomonadota bacterium]
MKRHVLVTGGTSGIGEGIARHLAANGWRVTVTGLTPAEAAAFAPDPAISATALDVTDDAAVAALFAKTDALGGLVNCAGTIQRAGAEFTVEGFRRTIEVNLVGTMRMCLAARPLLAASKGAIVNTASMLSYFGSPFVPGYSASKGGIVQLTKSLAAAWAADGIRVNAIAPGWIDTALTKPLVEDPARSAAILGRTPMDRWGKPEDLGGAVAFLLSDGAKFVTGTTLPVDGGYSSI